MGSNKDLQFVNNNLSQGINLVISKLNNLTLMLDSFIEASGEDTVAKVNKLFNKKTYIGMLAAKDDIRDLASSVNQQKEIDIARAILIEDFGEPFVLDCEFEYQQIKGGGKHWTKKNLIKI